MLNSSGLISSINNLLIAVPAIIIAIGFHEAAHAFVAYQLGDNTARNEGRLTLNPMSHIDPLGLLMLLICRFGWAKPVPINPNNFKNRKIGIVLTALAGPITNFIIAFIFAVIYFFLISLNINVFSVGMLSFLNTLVEMIMAIISINIGLGVFNFIPVPPLDGSKILSAFLPSKYYYAYIEREGTVQLIMLILVITGIVSFVISPIILIVMRAILYLASLFVGLFL